MIDFSLHFELTYFLHVTSVCDFYLPDFTSKIICLITFLEFFSFVYMTSKLNILSNYTKHPKRLVLYYILFLFIILKSLYPTGQLAYLKESNFSFVRKKSSHTKLGLQSFYQPLFLQVRPRPKPGLWKPPRVKRTSYLTP